MRFTVKRYDAVPTTESGGDGDGVGVGAAAPEDEDDDAAGQRATPPRDSPDTLSPEALTPRTPPSPSSMSKLPIAKLPPADVDLLDSTPMDSYTSTLFGREAQERDAVAHRGRCVSLTAHRRHSRRGCSQYECFQESAATVRLAIGLVHDLVSLGATRDAQVSGEKQWLSAHSAFDTRMFSEVLLPSRSLGDQNF